MVERRKILTIAKKIVSSLNQQDVTTLLASGLETMLSFDLMGIYQVEAQQNLLKPLILKGPKWKNPKLDDWSIPIGKGIIGNIIQTNGSELINNAHLDKRTVYPDGNVINEEHMIVVSLATGTECWGAFVLNRMSSSKFSDAEFETAQFLASYASLALSNIRLISQIKQEEELNRITLQSIPDNIIKADLSGTIISNNGKLKLEKNSKNLATYFPDSISSKILSTLRTSLLEKTESTIEFETKDSQGKSIYEVRVVPLQNNEGLILTRDITEARQAKSELFASEALKRAVLETLSDGLVTVNHLGVILFSNSILNKIFGYEDGELIGKPLSQLVPDSLSNAHTKGFNKYLTTGKRNLATWSSVELPGKHKNGGIIPLEISFGETIIEDEKVFSGLVRDITGRKIAEENLKSATSRLENLIKTFHTGILVEDEDRKMVLTNQLFCEMFNIPAKPEDMIGMNCAEAAEQSKIHFANPEQFINRITQLLNDRKPVVNEEWALADGKVFARDYVPIFVDENYKGHMWLYRDITKSKQIEKDLILAKQLAEDSMRAKQDFLAKMSHELRTPINGVLGLTNLMQASELNSENQEYLRGIKASGEQLLAIINDILDLAKIEAGKLKLEESEFSIKQVLNNISKNFSVQAKAKGIEFRSHIGGNVPEWLMGDPVRISQIILNLCSNALKFTSIGYVKLSCTALRIEESNCELAITIEDTGIGIPENRRKAIFERFGQADENTSVKYGGTGLGLTITMELTQMMNGEVDLKSETGKGSIFTVTLPFAISQSQGHLQTQDNVSFDELPFFDGVKILLVEDNLINQLVAKRTLERWHIEVETSENGLQAVEKSTHKKYDCILMDVQMPEMDGFQATQAIRSNSGSLNQKSPIIAMTASVLFDPAGRAKQAGMDDYISKPFKVEELHRLLTKYLTPKQGEKKKSSVQKNSAWKFLNFDFLESISPNSPGFYMEMITLFESQSVDLLEKMRKEFFEGEFHELSRTAHTMKPLGSYIGVDHMQTLLAEIEQEATSGLDENRMADLIAQVQILQEEVIGEIKLFKKNANKS